jgi:uncharacterized protein with PIN domain
MNQPRFVADVMVGKLARWLRVLGVDVSYSNRYADEEIIRIAESEARIILTRDAGLAARARRMSCIFIESDHYKQQVRQVTAALGLKEFAVFTRCLECNTTLEHVEKELLVEKVPAYVYKTQDRFAVCPSCNRIYWHGTHTDQMLDRVKSCADLLYPGS